MCELKPKVNFFSFEKNSKSTKIIDIDKNFIIFFYKNKFRARKCIFYYFWVKNNILLDMKNRAINKKIFFEENESRENVTLTLEKKKFLRI